MVRLLRGVNSIPNKDMEFVSHFHLCKTDISFKIWFKVYSYRFDYVDVLGEHDILEVCSKKRFKQMMR